MAVPNLAIIPLPIPNYITDMFVRLQDVPNVGLKKFPKGITAILPDETKVSLAKDNAEWRLSLRPHPDNPGYYPNLGYPNGYHVFEGENDAVVDDIKEDLTQLVTWCQLHGSLVAAEEFN